LVVSSFWSAAAHHQHGVPFADEAQQLLQLGTLAVLARDVVDEHPVQTRAAAAIFDLSGQLDSLGSLE
jgi:hypothetical protein